MQEKAFIGIALVAIIALSGCTQTTGPEPIACTADAKICPDGSAVGRDGANNCEFFACPAPTMPADFSITLERQGCFGFCPIYKITVKADGSVIYTGERNVKVMGEQTAQIGVEKAKQLFDKVTAMKFFALKEEYTENATFDVGSAVLRVTINGQTKEILHAFEDRSAPESLTELEDLIDELTNSKQWAEKEQAENVWLSYAPIQCAGNPWEIWHTDLNRTYIRAPTEQEILTEYFRTVHQVEILDYRQIPAEEGTVVCLACSCPRGDTIEVLVGSGDTQTMLGFEWELSEGSEPINTEAECVESGGEWMAHCGLIGDCCNYRTTDAGQACNNEKSCEGACMIENITEVQGKCSEWKTQFGCYNILISGQSGSICVD